MRKGRNMMGRRRNRDNEKEEGTEEVWEEWGERERDE